jgi:protein-tyrosine-phosphatase
MTLARPISVLFACNLNRVRSPMAAALARRLGGEGLTVDSCGLEAPEGVDPFVEAAMAEVGVDLSGHRPKTFADLDLGAFDLVISLTPEANRRALDLARGRAVEINYWLTEDPSLAAGSREQRLDAYRTVRDRLQRRLTALLGQPST